MDSQELVRVNFRGDEIEATLKDGHAFAGIRRMCENIGLGFGSQLQKLKTQRWAVVTMIVTTGADGKQYETAMLRADKIPMWLATLDVNRIGQGKPDAERKRLQDKIADYQDHAAQVLADHFLGQRSAPAAEHSRTDEMIFSLFEQVQQNTKMIAGLVEVVAHLRTEQQAVYEAPPKFLPGGMPIGRAVSIADRCADLQLVRRTMKDHAWIRADALSRIMLAGNGGDGAMKVGRDWYFFGQGLTYLDEAIRKRIAWQEQQDRGSGAGLFAGV